MLRAKSEPGIDKRAQSQQELAQQEETVYRKNHKFTDKHRKT